MAAVVLAEGERAADEAVPGGGIFNCGFKSVDRGVDDVTGVGGGCS